MTRWLPWVLVAGLTSCAHRAPTVENLTSSPKKAEPVAIEIPRRQGDPVVVLPLRLVRAPLTRKERDRIERWVARHLATQGQVALDVVSVDRERVGAEGPGCAARPSLNEVLTRAVPEAVRAQPVADCSSEPCRLTVSAARPGEAPMATWTAEVAEPGGFEQWESAAQVLEVSKPAAPSAPSETVLETSGKQPENPIAFTAVVGSGEWDPLPKPGDLQQWRPAFAKCHERGLLPTGPDLLVLEIGSDGKVAGCEAQSWRDPAEQDQLRCHCDAAKQMTFAPGEPERRLALELRDLVEVDAWTPDGARVTARILDYRSTDPALAESALVGVRPWLALCYATTRLRTPVRLPVQFDVAATGEITAARIVGDSSEHVLGACVEGYLRYLPLPCTRSGQPARMEFEVQLQREDDPEAPISRVIR